MLTLIITGAVPIPTREELDLDSGIVALELVNGSDPTSLLATFTWCASVTAAPALPVDRQLLSTELSGLGVDSSVSDILDAAVSYLNGVLGGAGVSR